MPSFPLVQFPARNVPLVSGVPEGAASVGRHAIRKSGILPGVCVVHPPLRCQCVSPVSRPSLSQLSECLAEEESPACTCETQQVSPVPKVVFVRPFIGRLEDLTTTCITTFHHSADNFVLTNNYIPSFDAAPVDPPCILEYHQRVEERVPPPVPSVL